METYRLNSRLVENNNEYLIKTTNDVEVGGVCSDVYVNGTLADSTKLPHPEHLGADELLAFVKATHGEKKKEVEELLRAYCQAMESGQAELLYHLGLTFFYKRFYAEARELLLLAVRLNPGFHEAYNILGQAELALGNSDRAVAAARAAVELRLEYADYRNNLGEALIADKSLGEAQEQFQKAIDINLYYSDAYFNCGLATVLQAFDESQAQVLPNLVSRAADFFNKASLTCQDYKTALFEKGLAALKQRDLRHTFSLLKKVRENKKLQYGRRYAIYHMKHALHPQWITEQAIVDRIKFLEDEICINPGYVDLHIELSRCYLEQARLMWKKGIDSYKKTMDMNASLGRLDSFVEQAEQTYDQIAEAIDEINGQD